LRCVWRRLHYAQSILCKIRRTRSATVRRAVRFFLDVNLSGLSFLLAMRLRSPWSADLEDPATEGVYLLTFSGVCATVYLITGLSFRSWRFVSIPDMFAAMRDIIMAVATFMILSFLFAWLGSVPFSVPFIACFIMITTLGGARMLYRSLAEGRLPFGFKDLLRNDLIRAEPVRLLAYGANAETDAFLRALESESARSYEVVGIIDDDLASRDRHIRSANVLGTSADLSLIVNSFAESSINLASLILPASSLPRKKLRELVDAAAGAGLKAVRLPRTRELLRNTKKAFAFDPIEATDLLNRDPVTLQLDAIDTLIRGKSIAVTGGGGSIGSELCRQLLKRGPAKLAIIDNCEFNLFNILNTLAAIDSEGAVWPVLASVRDRERLFAIFAEARTELVFHAAAYKHVPLVESNPIEGILTNVVGTSNVADAAAMVGAAAMIMISTDKAVKPANTMGLSKRIAEVYCQAMDLDSQARKQRTRFLVARFGNVLGSSGSVVPIFEEQIKNGGPVTVTDPAMSRYFMTIPEAVELVLQSVVFGLSHEAPQGAILVLEMGDPVQIVELAHRMILLAGFLPEKDIKIEFVGVRAGEKLHEELFDDNEMLETTGMSGIHVARSRVENLSRMRGMRDQILRSSRYGDAQAAIAMLHEALTNGSHASPSL
jgi:FlaA1/EpsC-like NDP-sugar epimerase